MAENKDIKQGQPGQQGQVGQNRPGTIPQKKSEDLGKQAGPVKPEFNRQDPAKDINKDRDLNKDLGVGHGGQNPQKQDKDK
jgi:hypothetical protein